MTEEFIVTEKAMRPASSARRCFYCNQDIGQPHKEDCVMIAKKVKVRAIIEYEVEVPSTWEKENVEFQRNEGSWCASNMIGELEELDEEKGCLCPDVEFEYLEDTSGPFLREG